MPLRTIDNTKHAPQCIKDLCFRGNNVLAFNFIPDYINQEINNQWIYYLMQAADLYGDTTNILTQYIYEHFGSRKLYDRYEDMFENWDETNDISTYCALLNQTIWTTLKNNDEKYRKMFEAQFLRFHPEWNVDGIETTTRTLDQTGTDTNKKTGDDSTTRTGNETDAKTGKEKTTRTGNEADEKTGTDTKTTSKTTFDDATFYDVEKVVDTPNTRKDTHTYNNVADELAFTDRVDTKTYNSVKDKTDYNSTDEETRNLHDREVTIYERHGNIGVVSTVKLLQEYVELAEQLNFTATVAKDIINDITYMVY